MGKILFRKMNILYVIILGFLFSAIFSTFADYSHKRAVMESETKGTYISVTYDSEQKMLNGVEEMSRIKTADYILKVDSTLTGNQCKTNDTNRLNEAKKIIKLTKEMNGPSCEVVGTVDASEIYPYDVLVSQETYDSIKDTQYTYLMKVNKYDTYKKLFWSGKANIPTATTETFIITFSMYYTTVYTLNSLVIISALIIVVIYFNTLSYIKANTKKTKKKVKDKSILNASLATFILTACGICLTILGLFCYSSIGGLL